MKNILALQSIDISEIDDSTRFSLHPFDTSLTSATEISITTIGIIHPPIIQKEKSSYRLICGKKRLSYLQQNNVKKTQCLVLPETTSLPTLLDLILTDQQLNAPLTIIERAYFLQLCAEYISVEETIHLFASKVPFRKHQTVIGEILKTLALEPNTILAIHKNIIAEQTALVLSTMNKADEKTIVELMCHLKPGGGKQKRIFSLLRDICGRKDISISYYLNTQEIRDILDHKETNIPQKTQQLTDYLQAETTPLSLQAEKNFTELKRHLNLPSHLSLNHSPAFEKDEITLTLHFKNIADFKNKWLELEKSLK